MVHSFAFCRLAAIMERFDEVDSSGRQVTTTSDDVTGSHDTTSVSRDTTSASHDTSSRSHDPPRSSRPSTSTSKHVPAGRPPSGASKIDSHRVTGMDEFQVLVKMCWAQNFIAILYLSCCHFCERSL